MDKAEWEFVWRVFVELGKRIEPFEDADVKTETPASCSKPDHARHEPSTQKKREGSV